MSVIQSKSFENFTYPYFSMEALLNMTADFPVNLLPRHDNDSSRGHAEEGGHARGELGFREVPVQDARYDEATAYDTKLERDADNETIKVAYRRLAKFYHPDGPFIYLLCIHKES
ncbi:hypothetical protein ZWY2020_004192 [Hordeum vulgare]|nr:hypothetical protein ZWY2020_004192 [Hordeum vulgare]